MYLLMYLLMYLGGSRDPFSRAPGTPFRGLQGPLLYFEKESLGTPFSC